MNRMAPGARACTCDPGVRCATCSESSRVRVRHITKGGDRGAKGPGGRDRERMTLEQIVDLRDGAWTARDLVSLYCDRDRTPQTWWEVEWPNHYARLLVPWRHCGRGPCAAMGDHEGTCAEASGWADGFDCSPQCQPALELYCSPECEAAA